MSDSLTITISVAAVFIALALLALLRMVIRRYSGDAKPWRRVRIGFFVEREHFPDD